jgi:ABC-type nitrate/sulfonate/bicarbonate transport system substrate-binding protein
VLFSSSLPVGNSDRYQAKARDFPILSIGSLLDEPFTGVVYLKDSGITTDFRTLKGKKIGYVGEFGKIQIDELTSHYGMAPTDYTAVCQPERSLPALTDKTDPVRHECLQGHHQGRD